MSDLVLIIIVVTGVIGLVWIVLAILAWLKPAAAPQISAVLRSAANGAAQVIKAFAWPLGAVRGLVPGSPQLPDSDGDSSDAQMDGAIRPPVESPYGSSVTDERSKDDPVTSPRKTTVTPAEGTAPATKAPTQASAAKPTATRPTPKETARARAEKTPPAKGTAQPSEPGKPRRIDHSNHDHPATSAARAQCRAKLRGTNGS